MNEVKALKRSAFFAVFMILILLATLSTSTYAWFTFTPYTNVTPMSSTIGDVDMALTISNTRDGTFGTSCELLLESTGEELYPLSTADLTSFFKATAQSADGITFAYEDDTDNVNSKTIHGTVYLKCDAKDCNIYFYQPDFQIGGDNQALAAMRLGIRITSEEGTATYIFKLDELGDTAGAESQTTIPRSGMVVRNLDGNGSATYVEDPSVSLSPYMATQSAAGENIPAAGETPLFFLHQSETASVEYWIYLEGCDDNCINVVQDKDISLQLGFAGVANQTEAQ